MAYRIEKNQKIQSNEQKIYYKGNFEWSAIFEERRVYKYKKDATADLYGFGGIIVSE